MEKKIIKQHQKGQKHAGKTDWSRVILNQGKKSVDDEENPELVAKKIFQRANKSQ